MLLTLILFLTRLFYINLKKLKFFKTLTSIFLNNIFIFTLFLKFKFIFITILIIKSYILIIFLNNKN